MATITMTNGVVYTDCKNIGYEEYEGKTYFVFSWLWYKMLVDFKEIKSVEF